MSLRVYAYPLKVAVVLITALLCWSFFAGAVYAAGEAVVGGRASDRECKFLGPVGPDGSRQCAKKPTFGSAIGYVTEISKEGYGENVTKTKLEGLLGDIIRGALTLVGAIFLIMMIYGGYNWMVDRGDSERVKVAKDTITRAIIGLIIVLGAYAITNFITGRLARSASGIPTDEAAFEDELLDSSD